jgi:hypothetical protein
MFAQNLDVANERNLAAFGNSGGMTSVGYYRRVPVRATLFLPPSRPPSVALPLPASLNPKK